MLWIKEVEMVDSVDELKSSRSIEGKDFPNFEMLDVRVASALSKLIQNSSFKEKVSLEEQEAQKEDRLLRGRHIAFMIYDYFRVTGAHDTALEYDDLFSVTRRNDDFQEFDTRWDEILLSMTKIPTDDILESSYKMRIRESDQLKTVLELYDMEMHQKISRPNHQRLKTMVKSIDQKLRLRHFDARHEKIETGAVVKSHKGLSGVERRRKTSAVSGMRVTIVHQNRHRKPLYSLSHNLQKARGGSVSRKRNARGRSQSENFNRPPCKYFLKGTCTKSPCEYWHPPGCKFSKTKSGCKFGAECSFPHWKVEEQLNKKPKKGEDKSAVGVVKSVRQLSCVSQDTEPPEFTTSLEGQKSVGTNSTSTIHKGCIASSKHPRKRRSVARENKKSKFLISEVPTL